MSTITFDVNNGTTLSFTLEQSGHDKAIKVSGTTDYSISPGDFIMLLNYYQHIKSNNIQCDFINPDGKNHDDHQYWSVTITHNDPDSEPWTAVFTDHMKAVTFMHNAADRLRKYGRESDVNITIDSGHANDTMYLDWIDELYTSGTETD